MKVCLRCGSEETTKDHVIPKSLLKRQLTRRQYAEWCVEARKINIQPLCSDCNGRKGDKAIDYRPVQDRISLKYLVDKWNIEVNFWKDF